MNTFKDLKLEYRYRSTQKNVYKDFYEKCLERSIIYDRAVGYFTSNSLKLISKGLEKFIINNGKIRITTSINLSLEDIEAMKAGEEIKIIEKNLIREWKNFSEEIEADTLKIFSWLIGTNKLEIKIAYKSDGIYHEKFGIFQDNDGNMISFSGSVNETLGGMEKNFESIEVFNSLDGGKDQSRIEEMQSDFEKLWSNNTENLKVITLPEALKTEIIKVKVEENEIKKIIEKIEKKEDDYECFEIPKLIEIRPYQDQALHAWFDNKSRGILEMATGTGKTITALNIMLDLYEKHKLKGKKICYLIVCPQSYLVNQWSEETENFKLKNIICSSENNKWKDSLNNKILLFNQGMIDSFAMITTTKTFQNKSFVRALKRIKYDVMIVADECHNFGSNSFKEFLEIDVIKNISYRLGLSATPDRQNDEEGNEIIEKYLGEIIFKYTLKKAIDQGYLTPYEYYPKYVSLSEDEEIEYIKLSRQIMSMSYNFDESGKTNNKSLEMLLFKRARLLSLAEEKIIKLLDIIDPSSFYNLIYAGPGKKENENIRSIDIILKKTRLEKNMAVEKFTSDEGKEERENIIKSFENKNLNAVVAIKCLDEGVNIPCIERAYILASTGNYREYVQRRGRVLRLSSKTGKKLAKIYDFIVLPRSFYHGEYSPPNEFIIEKKLLEGELKRVEEYNRLADNKYQNEEKLIDLKLKYNIF